jgi:hypothetical protein
MRGGFVAALTVAVGCYSPTPQAGAPCGAGAACPSGLVCRMSTNTCELDNTVPPIDGTMMMIDASGGSDAPLPPDGGPTGPGLVQQKSGVQLMGNSLALTFGKAPIAGHLLVMVGGDPQGSLTSVTGGGATWTAAAQSTENSNVEIWYGVTDGSSSTVTITLTQNVSPITAAISEWSGLVTMGPLDIARPAAGIQGPAGATITTTNARDLVILGVCDSQPNTWGTPAPGTWTTMMGFEGMFFSLGAWYQVQSTTGTIAARVSETGMHWDAVTAAFRIAP